MTGAANVLRGRTVIVRDGRIGVIGAADSVAVPAGALRIDGRGRYLMPGLADMHVHLEHSRDPSLLALFVANGVTTVRNMDGRPYILSWRAAIEQGRMLGPVIHTAGPILDGDPPLLPDNTAIATVEAARAEVRRQVAAGYDFIKVYTNLDAAIYAAVLEEAAAAGLPVAGHAPRALGLRGVLAAPLRSLEHLGDFAVSIEAADSPFRGRFHWAKLYLGMPVDTASLRQVARRVAASGMWVVPTLVERERSVADSATVARWLAEPSMALLPEGALDYWQRGIAETVARMDEADWRLIAAGRDHRQTLLRALHAAGVPLLVGSDTPNRFVVPGFSVHEELAAFVAAGLSAHAALSAATRDAARFLGQDDEWGSIAPGMRADLLMLAANPLEDVRAARRPLGVMLRGRWLPAERLDELLPGAR